MEFRSGNLLFTSKFDSGNLANVERVCKDEDEGGGGGNLHSVVPGIDLKPDYEHNVWTKPDCAGTEYENGNRSWFYFGIRGWAPNRLIKINIMNLNRQGKLYSQGHTPFVRTIPGKPKWDRLRDRPSFEMVDGQFILSFIYRFPEFKGSTTYFAFCFPWSYTESQNQMSELDNRFEKCKTYDISTPVNSIYYHRELACLTLDKLRVDLLTISSCHGITKDTEPRFDKHLFPDQRNPRCKRFKGKKVYFLSSRVHPGETPASFVFNGFLEFITREKDPRAIQLRKQYVFKLIPMLNPDGVMRGHYRTDPRGVNLNRVYLDPNPALHPSIYAAKSLLVYHHIYNRNVSEGEKENFQIGFPTSENLDFSPQSTSRTVVPNSASCDDRSDTEIENGANAMVIRSPHCYLNLDQSDGANLNNNMNQSTHKIVLLKHQIVEPLNLADLDGTDTSVSDSGLAPDMFNPMSQVSSSCTSVLSNFDQTKGEGRKVTSELRLQLSELTMSEDYRGDSAFTDKNSDSDPNFETEHLGNEGSDDDGGFVPSSNINAPHLVNPKLLTISPNDSGIAIYVDLHGHASKRGAFIYGNFLENEEMQIDNMLYTKLISLNTAHFDFTGCNFSERNMYSKDKRDGMSKEGSGRVSTLKAIGIIHSYTLECNYNTGRMVNPVPPAQNDDGQATPPPLAGFPPKYTQAHYEEIGKALAIAALDMTDSNPWSRIGSSEHCSLQGVRESVRRYLRSLRGGPRGGKNGLSRIVNRIGNTSSSNQNNNRQITRGNPSESSVQSRRRLSSDTTLAPGNPARRMSTDSTTSRNISNFKSQNTTRKELAPVKESSRGNQSRRPLYNPSHNSSSGKTASTASAPVLAMTRGHVDDVTYQRHMSADDNIRQTSAEKSQRLRNNSLLNIASKKQGPPTKLPLPTGSVGVHFPPNRFLNNNAQPRRHDSGSRRTLEDTIFHNDSTLMTSDNNLMSVRSGAPSSGHSGTRIAQSSGNSLHRVPMSSALSSTSSGLRTNSGTRIGVSSGNSVTRQPIRSTGDEDTVSAGESPKRKKKFSYLKRKPGMQSPKAMYVRGQDSSIYSNTEIDRKAKRSRRRKSTRKLSFLSDDEDITVPSTLPSNNSVAGNAVNLTPRHIINYSQQVTHPSHHLQKHKTSTLNHFKKLPSSTFDLSIWRRPTVTKKSVFWTDL